MEQDEISDQGKETLNVFERLAAWLHVDDEELGTGKAIPGKDPSGRDIGSAWADLAFDVPEEVEQVDWMNTFRTSFAHQYASDTYQEDAPQATSSGASASRRTKTQHDEGAS